MSISKLCYTLFVLILFTAQAAAETSVTFAEDIELTIDRLMKSYHVEIVEPYPIAEADWQDLGIAAQAEVLLFRCK